MNTKNHVTLGIGEDCIRMGGDIVEEVLHASNCVLCGCGLGRCEGAEGNKDGCINCSTVIQKGAHHLLDKFFVVIGERGQNIGWGGVLDSAIIGGYHVMTRLML